MKLRSSARGFLAFLLSLPALMADDWITYTSSNVCAPRGSTVNISCHYKCPRNPNITLTVKDKKWFSQRDVDVKTDTDYAGRVENKCSRPSCTSYICNANCTLSISDLRQSDSSEYKFRFKTYQVGILEYAADLGVTLSVTDLEVKVSFPMPDNPSWAVLECHSMCGLAGNATYIWIRNGQSAGEGMKYPGFVWSQYSYSCAVKGYKQFPSPSVYAPKSPSVTVIPSGEIEEGSSLTLSCSSDANPAADYTWFKEHGDSVGQSGQNYTITNITSELVGNYYCKAHNAIGSHISTVLFINWTEGSSSSQTTAIAVRTVAVLLASVLLLVAFLWMRRKKASRKAYELGTDTVDEVRKRLRKDVKENSSSTKEKTTRVQGESDPTYTGLRQYTMARLIDGVRHDATTTRV